MGSLQVGGTGETKSYHVGKCGGVQDMGSTEQESQTDQESDRKNIAEIHSAVAETWV